MPATPFARVLGFGGLAARLAVSTAFEAVKRQVSREEGPPQTTLLSEKGAERVAETLCKMRGAALKLGQMLSLQDEGLLPEPLAKALERVRQGADMMPRHQLYAQLSRELGEDWQERLREFEDTPVAAASIGQVHRAVTLDGRTVAIKVQYPGVANSIESDLNNLKTLVTYMNVLPPGTWALSAGWRVLVLGGGRKGALPLRVFMNAPHRTIYPPKPHKTGLYVDEIIDVAREELTRV